MLSAHRKSDLNQEPVDASPSQLYSNSTCRVTSSYKYRAILLAIEWTRVSSTSSTILSPVDLSTYQCSPLDLDCIIQIKIKYKTDQGVFEVVKKRGPVILESEIDTLVQNNKINIQALKVTTRIEDTCMPITFKLKQDTLVMVCKEAFQYRMRLEALPTFNLKEDVSLLGLGFKQYSQAMTKYFSAVLKRTLKVKLGEIQVKFESRFHKDLFLVKMLGRGNPVSNKATMKKQTEKHNSLSIPQTGAFHNLQQQNSIQSPPPNIKFASTHSESVPHVQKKGSTNSHKQAPVALSQAPQSSFEDRLYIRSTLPAFNSQEFKNEMQNLLNNDPKKSKECLNIFDESVLSDGEQQQDVLNLQDSFMLLETQERNQAELKASSMSVGQMMANNLVDAQNQITSLMLDIHILKQQNLNLKQEIVKISHNRGIDFMQQKIQHLGTENERLMAETAKLQQDLQSIQVKWKKDRDEKKILRQILEQFSEQKARLEKVAPKHLDTSSQRHRDNSQEKVKFLAHPKDKKRSSSPSNIPLRNDQASTNGQLGNTPGLTVQGATKIRSLYAALNPPT